MSEKTPMELFFENQVCMVVEPSKAFLASILKCLRELNLPATTQVISASRYEQARQMIEDYKPRILIAEYDMDGRSGLDLVELQQKFHEDQNRISVVVSKKSSDSFIVDAAEEQVDGFLLKPFSTDDFKVKLNQAIQGKAQPSAYILKIREGRKHLQDRLYAEAAVVLNEAKNHHPKPALAFYYLGQSYRHQGDLARALKEFQEGQKLQALHYKCLTAEFEVSMELKNYENANRLIPSLLKNFSLSPRLLTQIFTAALYSAQFENLMLYFEQFAKLDEKPEELVSTANSAFFEAGKWYLRESNKPQAMAHFEKALIIVGRDIGFLKRVIDEMLQANARAEAQEFLTKALPSDVGTVPYNLISFKIDEVVLEKARLMEKARELFLSGNADGETYKIIVRLFAQNGKTSLAEAAISKAIGTFPDLRTSLYQILETHSK